MYLDCVKSTVYNIRSTLTVIIKSMSIHKLTQLYLPCGYQFTVATGSEYYNKQSFVGTVFLKSQVTTTGRQYK